MKKPCASCRLKETEIKGYLAELAELRKYNQRAGEIVSALAATLDTLWGAADSTRRVLTGSGILTPKDPK